ncbi:RecQ family ATP-dependent DNA helicase [Lacticaseibacillus thailandensis]|nr:RecQ family ATP-dependent DNA helicase [Lacticaseibacillus thailandensis]
MRDQVARLQAAGERRVVALNSTLDSRDFNEILRDLDRFRFLFIAPEMLQRPDVVQRLRNLAVSLFVVDEAHCISQWGPDFRPAYLRLGDVIARVQPAAVLALTATAPRQVQADILAQLRIPNARTYIGSVNRPNLFLGVEQVLRPQAKVARLIELLDAVHGPTLVYCGTKRQTEELAAQITKTTGYHAAFYHAGLDAHSRTLRERQFIQGDLDVLCATSAFGMGVDKPNVRLVVHMFVPESLEDYSQAIGRAGRDGRRSVTELLLTPADLATARQHVEAMPDRDTIASVYAHPQAFMRMDDAQVQLILSYQHLGFTAEQVWAQLQARKTESVAGFSAMIAFIDDQHCHRSVWLRHFDSPSVAHDDEWCCGSVTPAVIDAMGQAPVTASLSRPAPQGWRAVFSEIFNVESQAQE